MREAWGLKGGQWIELQKCPMWEHAQEAGADAQSDFRDLLKSVGYSMPHDETDIAPVRIHEAQDDTPLTLAWPWFIEIELTMNRIERVFVATLPDLLSLAPNLAALNINFHLAELHQFVEQVGTRAFRAMHGHSPTDVRRECDPNEFNRRREWAEKRRNCKEAAG